MKIEHICSLPEGQIVETDICIVGSGPAGLTIARELSNSNLQLIVLESGGATWSSEMDSLVEIESVGALREMNQSLVRNRALGGTSASWSGRAAFFDEIDFERRDWVPYSGWPLKAADLRLYLPRTMGHLGLGLADNTDVERIWRSILHKQQRVAFDPGLIREYFWQYSQGEGRASSFMRFGPRAIKEKAPNVRCIVHATATHITTTSNGRVVQSIEVKGPAGERRTVRARITVLCAGGIENARLLLASNRIVRNGVGNEHDLVGRFLMDHPRGAIGEFEQTRGQQVLDRFGIYRAALERGVYSFTYGAALSPDVQRSEQLLNSAVWINGVRADDDPWMSVAALVGRQGDTMRHLGNAVSNLDFLLKGLKRRFINRRGVAHRLAAIELHCIVEQRPDPDSRITLAERLDAFGMPISRIDWRISEQESRTVKRLAQLFATELNRLGLAVPRLFDMARWDSDAPLTLPDVAHPMGATRMSTDPKSGVVDANCAVHGVQGLYIVGSSVFPSAGHANPTQMIVALSVRLADHLKTIMQPSRKAMMSSGPPELPAIARETGSAAFKPH